MTRTDVLNYIKETYAVEPDYPWKGTPEHAVLRHNKNRKWFGLLMSLPGNRLGLEGDSPIDILNLKCEPALIGSLRSPDRILPAYHMNKEHWITVLLNSPISDEEVCELIDLSYRLTRK